MILPLPWERGGQRALPGTCPELQVPHTKQTASLEHGVTRHLQQGADVCPGMSCNLLGDEGCAPQVVSVCLVVRRERWCKEMNAMSMHLQKSLVLPSQQADSVPQDPISRPVLEVL